MLRRPFMAVQRERTAPDSTKRPRWPLVGLVCVALLGVLNCDRLIPFSTSVGHVHLCGGKIVEYARTYPAPDPADQLTLHGIGNVQEVTFSNAELGELPNLYSNLPWKPISDGLPWQLKGTHLARMSSANADFAGDAFLEASLSADLQELVIGFDTRATSPPSWLARNFERIEGAVLRSTQKYKPSGSPAKDENVEYALWHPTPDHRSEFTRSFTLGGNNAAGVAWSEGRVGSQYLTFFRPFPWVDQSKTLDHGGILVEVCEPVGDSQEALLKAAEAGTKYVLDKWLREPEHTKYQPARDDGALAVVLDSTKLCTTTTDAPANPKTYKACEPKADQIGSLTSAITGWALRSSASLDPNASQITVRARGTTTSGPIRGRVSFAIGADNQAQIAEVTLFASALNVSGVSVDELSFGQAETMVASCTDQPPPGPSRLCKDYSIAVGEAAAHVSATLDGKRVFVPLENTHPIGIHIDFNKRSFAMSGGPIRGELPVDGSQQLVELWLDVTGVFDNLAPVASVAEMPARFKCVDRNRATVHLNAAASFDQDPGPGIVSYQWTEDAGLPTQRPLGNTKALDVEMNVGGHLVTLVVTDDRGAIDSKSILIDVFDPQIDSYDVPHDVFAIRQDRSGAVVSLGNATASDGCSGTVGISNDAPAGLQFPPGSTTVEWTFDDYNGNVVHQQQKVVVVVASYYPPPIASSYVLRASSPDGAPEIVYVYGTQGQGRRLRADEYVLLRSPSGRVYSVEASGRLVEPPERRAARSVRGAFGKAPTQGFLAMRAWGDALKEDGRYTISYVLTVPGGSPEEPGDILARDDVEFDFQRR